MREDAALHCARARKGASAPLPQGKALVRVVLYMSRRGGRRATSGGRMQLMIVFVVLLLVAIVAGICLMAERRSGRDRRRASRGGRRAADGSPPLFTPPSRRGNVREGRAPLGAGPAPRERRRPSGGWRLPRRYHAATSDEISAC